MAGLQDLLTATQERQSAMGYSDAQLARNRTNILRSMADPSTQRGLTRSQGEAASQAAGLRAVASTIAANDPQGNRGELLKQADYLDQLAEQSMTPSARRRSLRSALGVIYPGTARDGNEAQTRTAPNGNAALPFRDAPRPERAPVPSLTNLAQTGFSSGLDAGRVRQAVGSNMRLRRLSDLSDGSALGSSSITNSLVR